MPCSHISLALALALALALTLTLTRSAYTLTTVGYGDISMLGTAAERAFGTGMTLVRAMV